MKPLDTEKLPEGTQIRYVMVELVSKKDIEKHKENRDAITIYKGFFMGIYLYTRQIEEITHQETYILMTPNLKEIHVYNYMEFNILSIEFRTATSNEYRYCQNTEEDQQLARNTLFHLLANLQVNNKTLKDKEIVDVSKYEDYVMLDLFGANSEVKPASTTLVHPTSVHNTPRSTTSGFVNRTTTYPTVEKKPTFIKRKSKKPTKQALDKMLELTIFIDKNGGSLKGKTGLKTTPSAPPPPPTVVQENAGAYDAECESYNEQLRRAYSGMGNLEGEA